MTEDLSLRVRHDARTALDHLGLKPLGPLRSLPTPWDRPQRQVLHTPVTGSRRGEVAVKVLLDPDPAAAAAFAQEHDLPRVLSPIADSLVRSGEIPHNPIVQLLHREPVQLSGSLVAVTRFARAGGPLDATTWGRTLGILHRIGTTPSALRRLSGVPGKTLAGLHAQTLVEAFQRPGHPFHDRSDLALRFAHVLRERVTRALELDPEPLLAHRDFHALNCVPARTGAVVLDWQEAGWGSRSDDFAWLYLTVSRFGGLPQLLDEAKTAYRQASGGICPSDEQIRAAGQVRELLCLGFSLAKADRSPRHRREALNQLPILRDPQARTRRWRMLHNPAIFSPGIIPSRRTTAARSA
ncbi:hypothetical protein GCM10022223_27990 [Kineosporia mesophila]|uniref:Aminoglycoside phosphotransferase domain-containing protein n=1 Tax=Kineosporia mesophila TaxID=566012 RepID=A0ABP6ZJ09_9ACTN|nr:phosphotransferase [Kineosporia mesophila]MCD5353468.1 aminoglycoside phosphotransferase family protein [Kineosporia mesophila]